MGPVIATLKRLSNRRKSVPEIIAVFGNEEYMGSEQEYISKFSEITWIGDSYSVISVDNKRTCIVGSRNVLAKATSWQQRNIPNIYEIFNDRISRIKNGLKICKDYALPILATHYASSFNI